MNRKIIAALMIAVSSALAAGCGRQEGRSPRQQEAVAQTGAGVSSAGGAQAGQAQKAAADVKVYRGSLNDRGFEMRLAREGERVSGAYAYDGIGQELKLEGRAAGEGKFGLSERDAAGHETGRWSCERGEQGQWAQGFDCKWTKPDGKGDLFAALEEQAAAPQGGWRVAAKTFENRKAGARASYPQIVAGAQGPPAAAEKFNRAVEKEVLDEVGEFAKNVEAGTKSYLYVGYNVLISNDDLISVEFEEDSYAGGAHPNLRYWAMTYDLRADRVVRPEDIFKPNSGYAKAVAAYCAEEIRKRAGEMAGGSGEDSPVSREQLEQFDAFGVTSKGLMIYYDLPHVIAALDRNFVPYSALKDKLRPDGPAARLAQ